MAVTVTSTADDPDPLKLARQRVTEALGRGYEALRKPHVDWWARFWSRSAVNLPEKHILQHYYLVRYLWRCLASRGTAHAAAGSLDGRRGLPAAVEGRLSQ